MNEPLSLIAPTIMDAAGLSFGASVAGRSVLPLLSGTCSDWREDLLCGTYGHQVKHQGRLLVTERYKYIINLGQKNELYDLHSDPYELRNLIDSQEHQTLISDLHSRMNIWREETDDTIEII